MSDEIFDIFRTTGVDRSARREAEEALALADGLSGDVGDLKYHVRSLIKIAKEQRQALERVEAVVGVMTELLLASGALERTELQERVAKAMIKPPPVVAKPASTKPAQITCRKCSRSILSTSAFMTENGLICPDCYQAQEEAG